MNFIHLANSFMPPDAATYAKGLNGLYIFLLVSSFIGCVLSIGGMIYFTYKYRRKSDNDKTAYITHNYTLEFLWSFLPLVVFLVSFFWGYKVYSHMKTFPKNAYEVNVTAMQWSWSFRYKEGIETANRLVVPLGKPVKLLMTSKDVLHSFFVPAFRNKMDVLPGKYTAYWFEATQEGEFDLFCTEYCGFSHSGMIAKVVVLKQPDFEAWIKTEEEKAKMANTKDPVTLAKVGKEIFEGKGACFSCHSIDGSPKVGPSLKALSGAKREFADGTNAVADENYLRESILQSRAKVVKGFAPSMPIFQGQLKDNEVLALIEYIKTLK
ncbi:MAG: cytochrome c oxidase subunit II [Leptospiraceae bacterium]|nr:cytochrome c oxidase subunit II [Leptospiraceae bacterium]MCP5499190.1 cytochrome c oxidase subunit II [Leptospiraceae bacterium]